MSRPPPNDIARQAPLGRLASLLTPVHAPLLTAMLAFAIACAPAPGQDGPDDTRDGQLERYLEQRGLDRLLAQHLETVITAATGTRRIAIAERLGSTYARILARSDDPLLQADTIAKASDLLEAVPAADSFDLRIALIKARYLRAEETAERYRLLIAGDDERERAAESMSSIAGELAMLASTAGRRVESMERRERSGSIADPVSFRAELAEARRQRSLASYYAGWSNYYDAMLTGERVPIRAALEHFGVLLGGDGREPSIDKMPKSLLRYEHVARAAVGVALSHGLSGNHRLAVAWLEALEGADDANPEVIAQLFNRRVTLLAGARRWDALARSVERRRDARLSQPSPNPLRVAEARLLAVEVLGAVRASDSDQARRDAVEPIVQCALSDLIARSETAQVLDLVDRFGTLPIGDEGFIAQYVRGLRAYRAARARHESSPLDPGKPTRDPELVEAYLEAADLLAYAFANPDAAAFVEERANTGIMLGMALYYKDTPAEAADRFEETTRIAPKGDRHAESLWMTVASLERAVENGRTELGDRLRGAAALFVRMYPGTDRAARLLLRFADDDLLDPDAAVAMLLELDRSSPIYDAARAHAADTLYRRYARSREPARTTIASRFLPVAMDRIEAGLRTLRDGDVSGLDGLLIRARQALDAALTPLATDPSAARRAFAALQEIGVRAPDTLASADIDAELIYRKLQLAIAEGDADAERSAYQELSTLGGAYLDAAGRFLFERARAAWADSGDPADARRVVEIGTGLLGTDEIPRARLTVADSVANAATSLWTTQTDRVMLMVALDLDRLVARSHTPTSGLLRRLAKNAEAAEEPTLARETWERLAAALPPSDPAWYEARYESIRLLADQSRDDALAAIHQHAVLYPDLGPPPWGDRLRALMVTLESGGRP